jgi:hypothetical protein
MRIGERRQERQRSDRSVRRRYRATIPGSRRRACFPAPATAVRPVPRVRPRGASAPETVADGAARTEARPARRRTRASANPTAAGEPSSVSQREPRAICANRIAAASEERGRKVAVKESAASRRNDRVQALEWGVRAPNRRGAHSPASASQARNFSNSPYTAARSLSANKDCRKPSARYASRPLGLGAQHAAEFPYNAWRSMWRWFCRCRPNEPAQARKSSSRSRGTCQVSRKARNDRNSDAQEA